MICRCRAGRAEALRPGADGVFRDAPRGRAFAAASPEQVGAAVERPPCETPLAAMRWTPRSMAEL
jgi:hypothetical protein